MWYDVGTISVTNGSTTVTGSGTDFISGVQVGEGLYIGGDLYEIGAIVSGTQLTLADAYLGSTATGQDYKIIPTQSLVADLSSGVADLISDFADVRDYAGSGKFNDGTASSPAITFTQDQNNGLYRIGSDNWGLVAGGEKIVDVSTNGIKLDDNNKATFGTSDDLQIYHDGSNSYVKDVGTGTLNLQGATQVLIASATTGEVGLQFIENAGVNLRHNNVNKFATTSTGVNVTGTVTADGLEVDGQSTLNDIVTINTTNPRLRLLESDTTDVNTDIRSSSGDFQISTINDAIDIVTKRFTIDHATGDVSFFEDTGTTAKMVWSSSAENLSIGNIEGLPNGSLSLKTTASGHAISLEENSGTERWQLGVNAAGDLEFINSADSDASIVFDDSGNVGIGTASPASTLDIVGRNQDAIKIRSDVAPDNYYQIGRNQSTGLLEFKGSEATYNGYLFKGPSSDFMTIDSSGNVGIGTTSPSSALDVTGTVTADGLVVSNSASIATIIESTTTTVGFDLKDSASFTRFTNSNGTFKIDSNDDGSGGASDIVLAQSGVDRLRIEDNGDVLFYEDTGTTAKMVWDASEERLGLGTSSPQGQLAIANDSNTDVIEIDTKIGHSRLMSFDRASSDEKYLQIRAKSIGFALDGAGDDVTIDSSGNLLVGTTDAEPWNNSAGNNTDNGAVVGSAYLASSQYNNASLRVNRTGTDGDLQVFYKNGSPIGSIGSVIGQYLRIGTSDTGIMFQDGSSAIEPRTQTSNNDGAINLGAATNRFKHLYLSGGVYLGGTGAANKLDDYETGVFSLDPSVSGLRGTTTNPTYTLSRDANQYIKIGDYVTVYFDTWLNGLSAEGAGSLYLTLPFTSASIGAGGEYYGTIGYSVGFDVEPYSCMVDNGLGRVYLIQRNGDILPTSALSSTTRFRFSVTYRAA